MPDPRMRPLTRANRFSLDHPRGGALQRRESIARLRGRAVAADSARTGRDLLSRPTRRGGWKVKAMTTANPHGTQAMDWLFSHYNALDPVGRATRRRGDGARHRAAPGRPRSAPGGQERGRPAPANEWLQRERRACSNTPNCSSPVSSKNTRLLSQKHLNEQAMILGCQELSSKEEILTRQSIALQQQAAEMSLREQAVARMMDQWSRSHEDHAEVPPSRVQTEAEARRDSATCCTPCTRSRPPCRSRARASRPNSNR